MFPGVLLTVKEDDGFPVLIAQADEIAVLTIAHDATYGDGLGDVIAPACIVTTTYFSEEMA